MEALDLTYQKDSRGSDRGSDYDYDGSYQDDGFDYEIVELTTVAMAVQELRDLEEEERRHDNNHGGTEADILAGV